MTNANEFNFKANTKTTIEIQRESVYDCMSSATNKISKKVVTVNSVLENGTAVVKTGKGDNLAMFQITPSGRMFGGKINSYRTSAWQVLSIVKTEEI